MSFVQHCTLLLPLVPLALGADHKWAYDEADNNVSHWADFYPECGSWRQSPVDITFDIDENGTSCDEPLLLDYEAEVQHFAVRNSGHTVSAIPFEISHAGGDEISGLEILHHTNDTDIRLKNSFYRTYDSNVNKEYCFDSLHFHWGETDEYGSEHALNGQLYPLEVHLVHYSCDYYRGSYAQQAYMSGEAEELYDDANVLAVIGVLFEIGEANPAIEAMLSDYVADKISFFEATSEYPNFIQMYYSELNLTDLIPENREMVAYLGSLTTPPCFETVRWHVMKNTMTVSLEQMMRFRMILASTDVYDDMAPNWRPLQPLNNRTLYQCQETVDDETVDGKEWDIVDGHEEDDHSGELLHELEGSSENIMWIAIGVAFILICWLTYIIHCKETPRHGHGSGGAQALEDSAESDNLVDITAHEI